MSRDELVSVIVPVYNGARYLIEALASIQRQRYLPIEVVIVDDGSSDGSFDLAQTFPGVSCFRQANRGAAAARNAGIREAKGTFLAFLDADDLWTDEKLVKQMAVIHTNSDVQLVAGRIEEFCEKPAVQGAIERRRQIGERAYTIGAMLIRRADFLRVGMMDESLTTFGEFIDWHSRAVACGLRERVLESVVLRRRIHGDNATLQNPDTKASYVAAIRSHILRNRKTPNTIAQGECQNLGDQL